MYNIKIYNLDWTYKFTLNTKAIKNDIAFSASINSWQWQLSLKLDKAFIDTSLVNTDIIKVYNKTTLIYTGIVQAIIRVVNSDFEEISLPILWIWTITSYILYRDTWSATFTKTQDPSQTIKDIIDYLNTIYMAWFFSYDSNSIEMYWTSVAIDFDNVSCFKALQQCIKITDFKLFINNDWKVYFKSKPLTSDHRLTVWKDITNISVNEYSEKLVNKLIVKYKTSSKTYEDITSQNTYWVKEIVISKTDLDLAWADEFWNNYIATYKQPINKTTIILNKNFDFNLIKIWDTVRVNNFKYSIRNLQVVKYTYSKNQMTLLLEDFDNFGTALWWIVWNTDFAPTSSWWGTWWVAWGWITWTLSSQTDLQSTLNAKENSFTKNSAFNKNFWTLLNEVAQWNHNHSWVYEPVFTKKTAFNKDFWTSAWTILEWNTVLWKVWTKLVDETNIADWKIIQYNATTWKFEYIPTPTWWWWLSNITTKTTNYTAIDTDDVILCDTSWWSFDIILWSTTTWKKFNIKIINTTTSIEGWANWTVMPITVWDPATWVVWNKIYFIWWQNPTTQSVNQIYDILTDTWSNWASYPNPIIYCDWIVDWNNIYLIWWHNWTTYVNYNYHYDTVLNTWTWHSPMSTSRYWTWQVLLNWKIYVIWWYSTGSLWTNEVYDIATNTWSTLALMPTVRWHTRAVEYLWKIYVVSWYINWSPTQANEEYNPITNTWISKASIPIWTWWGWMTLFKDKLYYIWWANTIFNTVYIYDFITNSWTTWLPMPSAKWHFKARVVNNKIYCVWGYRGGASPYTSITNYIYTPQYSNSVNIIWTIDWSVNKTINTIKEAIEVIYNGTDWEILSKYL